MNPSFADNDDLHRIKNNAAVWKILKTSGGVGGPVRYGDEIVIENQYTVNGSHKYFLERNSGVKFTTSDYRITMKAAVWKIIPLPGSSHCIGEDVQMYEEFLIQNQYGAQHYLERNVVPSLRSSSSLASRIANEAAVWIARPSGAGCPVANPHFGAWTKIRSYNGDLTFIVTEGTERSSTQATTQEWSHEMSVSVSTGFDIKMFSNSVEASYTFSYGLSQHMESTFAKSTTESTEITCNGTLFQFTMQVDDDCSGAVARSGDYACLPIEHEYDYPCCLPQENEDYSFMQCKPGSLNLCTGEIN